MPRGPLARHVAFGLDRKTAAEFSFFAAVPIMFAATGKELFEASRAHLFSQTDLPWFGTGFIVSFIVALVAVKVFIGIVSRFSLRPFAWYRIALAAALLTLFLMGWVAMN